MWSLFAMLVFCLRLLHVVVVTIAFDVAADVWQCMGCLYLIGLVVGICAVVVLSALLLLVWALLLPL